MTSTGTLAESIEVGYIQTLRSSNRVGIYTKGGNETSRDRSSVPKSRDARPYVDQRGAKSVSRPPWYDSEKGGVTGLSSGGDAKIHTIDKPSFVLNAKADDGAELTATEGTENFVLSVAAKPFGSGTATPIPGGSIKWGFSWSQSIDAKGAGSGGGAATQSPDQGEDVSSEGEIAKNSMHSWLDFKTKEQAKMHSASTLVDNLGKASAAGPDAAIALASTVEALRDINPRFTATVDAITRSSLVGADQLAVTIGAKGSFTSSQPVNKNAPAKIGFNLMTVCSSPLELLSGLTVSVSVTSDWRDGTVGVARFPSVSEMATGKVVEAGSSPKGSYNVSISL